MTSISGLQHHTHHTHHSGTQHHSHRHHAAARANPDSTRSSYGADNADPFFSGQQLLDVLSALLQSLPDYLAGNTGPAGLNVAGWPTGGPGNWGNCSQTPTPAGPAVCTPSGSPAPVQGQGSLSARQGATVHYNPFTSYSTQCTYGAMNLVLDETGGNAPDLTGNADQWDAQARQEGWTVVRDNPTPGSIAVFQPNSQLADGTYGHVAVVVSVNPQNHTAVIEEMNNPVLGGPGKYNFRTISTSAAGTDFIEVPQNEITNPLSTAQTVST